MPTPVDKGKGAAVEEEDVKGKGDGASNDEESFTCASCLRPRLLPEGLSSASVSRCCDVPDAQVMSMVGGGRVAAALLQAGIATQEALAALDVDDTDGRAEQMILATSYDDV